MSATELAEAVSVYDGNKTIYFVHIDREGESTLFNIKDGGTKDRNSEGQREQESTSMMTTRRNSMEFTRMKSGPTGTEMYGSK